jgi:hypothetical protein
MSDSNLIWKFLLSEFKDDSLVVYLYVGATTRSRKTAIDNAMKTLRIIFCPSIDENFVKSVLIGYLDRKKEDYKKGLIKIKNFY